MPGPSLVPSPPISPARPRFSVHDPVFLTRILGTVFFFVATLARLVAFIRFFVSAMVIVISGAFVKPAAVILLLTIRQVLYQRTVKSYISWPPPRGGGTPKKLGRSVRPASQNPYPIYDQILRFSLPYL